MSDTASEDESEHDVMISYSHADSKQVAKELYEELTAYGLDVWYDGVKLNIGDNIQESIDKALSKSDHAVIIMSPTYFEGMSQLELGGLVQIHNDEDHNVLLPVLHKMDFEELREESPSLAGIIGKKISEDNVAEVTADLYSAIESSDANAGSQSNSNGGGKRTDIRVSMEDFVDISKGSRVIINEWRTSGTPHSGSITAVKMTVEESGLSYSGSNFMGTSKVIKNEPLEGHISNITEKSAGKTEFTLRIPQSRLDELSDDRDDYKSGLVG
ncbi:toll/interleukin-1 receptor domain-containing protein [Haloarcula sp. H-GB5]